MRRPLVLLGAAALVLVAACEPKPSSPSPADIADIDVSPDQTITVDDDGFDPETLVVDPGQVIEIRNTGDRPHTATAESRFDTGLILPGESSTLVLSASGEIPFLDATTPDHTATLTVTPEP